MPENYDVVIIGAGPAGIFAALELKKLKPQMNVLLVDQGRSLNSRTCPARVTGKC
ncbi:MAG TPA: FAD-dependent oxidoreductase, partial [Clostridia bacterium]|nr:FAD-dependent oxidoreductase [Clostridia bacterium]